MGLAQMVSNQLVASTLGVTASPEAMRVALAAAPELRLRVGLALAVPHALALALASAAGGFLVGRYSKGLGPTRGRDRGCRSRDHRREGSRSAAWGSWASSRRSCSPRRSRPSVGTSANGARPRSRRRRPRLSLVNTRNHESIRACSRGWSLRVRVVCSGRASASSAPARAIRDPAWRGRRRAPGLTRDRPRALHGTASGARRAVAHAHVGAASGRGGELTTHARHHRRADR
jgi:hypothetical protein